MRTKNGNIWLYGGYKSYQQNTAIVENSKTIPIYSNSHNRFDESQIVNDTPENTFKTLRIQLTPNTSYTMSSNVPLYNRGALIVFAPDGTSSITTGTYGVWEGQSRTFTSPESGKMIVGYRGNSSGYDLTSYWYMINEGSTALPYEPYYKPLVSYSFEGQCSQASTPTPSSPVEVECFGDLIASGDNDGKYDIPITSGGVTEHIILSEPLRKIGTYADSVNSEGVVTRRIGKIVLTGEESWRLSGGSLFSNVIDDTAASRKIVLSTHFVSTSSSGLFISVGENRLKLFANSFPTGVTNSTSMKTWLAQQYTNGTPVIVYYVLATAIPGAVTMPSIPTSSGFSNIEIGTSLAPSKFTYDLGKMFVPKGQGKVRQNGEWI